MQNCHILIIEDDDDIRGALKDFLASEGHEAACVCNGKEALEYLEASKGAHPSLIFLDLMMPIMDGRTFLSHFKRLYPDVSIPIVITSAAIDRTLLSEVALMLKKPFDLDDILNATNRFLSEVALIDANSRVV